MADEPNETVVMGGEPRERGTPEDDAARNDPKADRWRFGVADVDLRVHPVKRRTFVPRSMMRGGFKR